MAPELVQFHYEYNDRMIVRAYNLSKYPPIDGFEVTAIPTQFIFDATGAPFRPKELALGSSFELIGDAQGNHMLTRHVGVLTFGEMAKIYEDMTSGQ